MKKQIQIVTSFFKNSVSYEIPQNNFIYAIRIQKRTYCPTLVLF